MTKRKKRWTIGKKIVVFILIAILTTFSMSNIPLLEKVIYPYPHRTIIEKYASMYGVDPLFVVSVIREESKFLSKSESHKGCLLYTSPSPRDGLLSRMPSSA